MTNLMLVINIGTGTDVTIKMLAQLICKTVDYNGELKFDTEKPDGTPRKLLDISRANQLGGNPHNFRRGIKHTIRISF